MPWVDVGGGQWNWTGAIPSDFMTSPPPLPDVALPVTPYIDPFSGSIKPASYISPTEALTGPAVEAQPVPGLYSPGAPVSLGTPPGGTPGDSGLAMGLILAMAALAASRMKGLRL